MKRQYPKTGEIWQHYRGEECLILGVLKNGSRRSTEQGVCANDEVVAYELVKKTYYSCIENKNLESIATKSISRFYRSIEDFMGTVVDECGETVNRFVLAPDDISAEIWEKSFAIIET